MKRPFFTIITVTYNSGDKLLETIESIKEQTFTDYRILVKDGMSTDGSIEKFREKYSDVELIESCDNGIYHAMNIAITHLEKQGVPKVGEAPSYVFFLNCGDTFKDKNVLKKVHNAIVSRQSVKGTTLPAIFYGDIFEVTTGQRVASNPHIDDHACYRNVPSHQACFYDERLMYRNRFNLKYKVRADYEQFLRCFYGDKAETVYIPMIIANYEGGGYSDKNKKISESERKEIIKMYLPASKVFKYDLIRALTLAHFRTFLSSNKVTAGGYNAVKNTIYRVKYGRKRK
jgi:glycosyltransferase involved in cell wall biosynthesis